MKLILVILMMVSSLHFVSGETVNPFTSIYGSEVLNEKFDTSCPVREVSSARFGCTSFNSLGQVCCKVACSPSQTPFCTSPAGPSCGPAKCECL